MPDQILVKQMYRLMGILVLALALSGCQPGQRPSKGQFTAGRQALMRGEFQEAIEKLERYLRRNPSGGLASRASFLIAKAQLGRGDLHKSRAQFEHTIRTYGGSEEAHKSRYKLGMLSLLEGDRDAARRRFASLVESPNGTLVPEATAMLAYLAAADAAGADPPTPKAP